MSIGQKLALYSNSYRITTPQNATVFPLPVDWRAKSERPVNKDKIHRCWYTNNDSKPKKVATKASADSTSDLGNCREWPGGPVKATMLPSRKNKSRSLWGLAFFDSSPCMVDSVSRARGVSSSEVPGIREIEENLCGNF